MTLIDVALLLRPIGRLGSRLVSLSPKLVAIGPGLVEKATATNGKKIVGRFPNSIDTLRPEARSVVAMNRLPIASSITYYSIVAELLRHQSQDRGKDFSHLWKPPVRTEEKQQGGEGKSIGRALTGDADMILWRERRSHLPNRALLGPWILN
jgi:hypothetical protein